MLFLIKNLIDETRNKYKSILVRNSCLWYIFLGSDIISIAGNYLFLGTVKQVYPGSTDDGIKNVISAWLDSAKTLVKHSMLVSI